jgi:hypothetical protein
MAKPPRGDQRGAFLQELAAGLKSEPAYLLIFGVAALFFLFGIGSAAAATLQRNETLWFYAFCGLLASLVAAVLVVWLVRPTQNPESPKPEEPDRVDRDSEALLYSIHQNVKKALTFDNETFREAVKEKSQDFLAETGNWSKGTLATRERYYNKLLLGFYESAKESVFSTSIPIYLQSWTGDFGERIIEAHQKSGAHVTRIFVFNTRDDVTQQAVDVMQRQTEANISVRVFFSDDSTTFQFPPDVSNDFTVIDHGAAIGVSVSLGDGRSKADWYISDPNQKGRFELLCTSLGRYSEKFQDFKKRWDGGK